MRVHDLIFGPAKVQISDDYEDKGEMELAHTSVRTIQPFDSLQQRNSNCSRVNSFNFSMSEDYRQHQASGSGIYGFVNGLDRSQQIEQQIRKDKVRLQGVEAPPMVVTMEQDSTANAFETAGGMLSEMFNYSSGPAASSATELLEHQMLTANYHHHHRNITRPPTQDWYGDMRQDGIVNDGDSSSSAIASSHHHHHHHQEQGREMSTNNINASSDAAMQLFLMNPSSAARSHSPSPSIANSTLHMLLPNSSTSVHNQVFQGPPSVGANFGPSSHQFTWLPPGNAAASSIHVNQSDNDMSHLSGHVVDHRRGQGLSLSLSSSLQHLEAAKAEEFRMGDSSGVIYFNHMGSGGGPNASNLQYPYKNNTQNLGISQNQGMHLQGEVVGGQNQFGFGSNSTLGVVNVLRGSKYLKAAQELLEEFCSVGRGQFKTSNKQLGRQNSINPNSTSRTSGTGANSSAVSSSKDPPALSASERIDHQRRKVKLLSMLDEACFYPPFFHSISLIFFSFHHV